MAGRGPAPIKHNPESDVEDEADEFVVFSQPKEEQKKLVAHIPETPPKKFKPMSARISAAPDDENAAAAAAGGMAKDEPQPSEDKNDEDDEDDEGCAQNVVPRRRTFHPTVFMHQLLQLVDDHDDAATCNLLAKLYPFLKADYDARAKENNKLKDKFKASHEELLHKVRSSMLSRLRDAIYNSKRIAHMTKHASSVRRSIDILKEHYDKIFGEESENALPDVETNLQLRNAIHRVQDFTFDVTKEVIHELPRAISDCCWIIKYFLDDWANDEEHTVAPFVIPEHETCDDATFELMKKRRRGIVVDVNAAAAAAAPPSSSGPLLETQASPPSPSSFLLDPQQQPQGGRGRGRGGKTRSVASSLHNDPEPDPDSDSALRRSSRKKTKPDPNLGV